MWTAQRKAIEPSRSEKVIIVSQGRMLSFAEVIAGWCGDTQFRAFFAAQLAATPFPAFFWEMPPVRQGQTNAGYEYMTVRSEGLERIRAHARAFETELKSAGNFDSVASFPNLGGDAMLVAPRQIAEPQSYGHIAAFVRSAPIAQQHELFQTLGRAADRVLRERKERIWISTSGLGVPWLHIRLDTCPKYYTFRPYAEWR